MEAADYIEMMVEFALEQGDSNSITQLRDKAFNALKGGNGSDIIGTNESGKSVTLTIAVPAIEMMFICQKALKILKDGGHIITTTTPDFRWMDGYGYPSTNGGLFL